MSGSPLAADANVSTAQVDPSRTERSWGSSVRQDDVGDGVCVDDRPMTNVTAHAVATDRRTRSIGGGTVVTSERDYATVYGKSVNVVSTATAPLADATVTRQYPVFPIISANVPHALPCMMIFTQTPAYPKCRI